MRIIQLKFNTFSFSWIAVVPFALMQMRNEFGYFQVDHVNRECTCNLGNCIELLAVEKVLSKFFIIKLNFPSIHLRVHCLTDFPGMCKSRQCTRIVPKKKCTLTQANKRAIPKNTGKKAHIKLGPRSSLIPTLGTQILLDQLNTASHSYILVSFRTP